MPLPKSISAYGDCRDALDRALESERGIKIECETSGMAIRLRHRMNSFRSRDRQTNSKTYEATHPMHNASAYDKLILRIVGSDLLIEKVSSESLTISEL